MHEKLRHLSALLLRGFLRHFAKTSRTETASYHELTTSRSSPVLQAGHGAHRDAIEQSLAARYWAFCRSHPNLRPSSTLELQHDVLLTVVGLHPRMLVRRHQDLLLIFSCSATDTLVQDKCVANLCLPLPHSDLLPTKTLRLLLDPPLRPRLLLFRLRLQLV